MKQGQLGVEIVAGAGCGGCDGDRTALARGGAEIGLGQPCASELIAEGCSRPAEIEDRSEIAMELGRPHLQARERVGGNAGDQFPRAAVNVVAFVVKGISGFGDDEDEIDLGETPERTGKAARNVPTSWIPTGDACAGTTEVAAGLVREFENARKLWARQVIEREARSHLLSLDQVKPL